MKSFFGVSGNAVMAYMLWAFAILGSIVGNSCTCSAYIVAPASPVLHPRLAPFLSKNNPLSFSGNNFPNPIGERMVDANKVTPLIPRQEPPRSRLMNLKNIFEGLEYMKLLQWTFWAISYILSSSIMHNLYQDVSMTRYALRFGGALKMAEGSRVLPSRTNSRGSPFAKFLASLRGNGSPAQSKIQRVAQASIFLYYPMEHIAFLGWQIPTLLKVDANWFAAMSCRFWGIHLLGDIVVNCMKWFDLRREIGNKAFHLQNLEYQGQVEQQIQNVKIQILRSLLFLLPAIHWSFPAWAASSVVGEPLLNGLMLAEAYTGMFQKLKSRTNV